MNRKPRGYWTKERCIEEAGKYSCKSELKKGTPQAYKVLHDLGILNEVCEKYGYAPPSSIKIWTKNKCIEVAKQCKTKSEFETRFNGAYKISKKYGWLNEIKCNFKPIGSKYNRCIYACEFDNHAVYVGLTYNFEKRCKQHLKNSDSAVFKYVQQTKLDPKFKIIIDYIPYNEAAVKEGEVLDMYKECGWTILNRAETGSLGSKDNDIIRKWTKDKCWEIVRKCKTYNIFTANYRGAKSYAERNGFIEEIKQYYNVDKDKGHKKWNLEQCAEKIKECHSILEYSKKYPGAYGYLIKTKNLHLLRNEYNLLQRDKWSFEEARDEALKYKTKKEFNEKASGCYQVCYKRGWLDHVCEHMIDLKKERIIYNEDTVKNRVSKHTKMEHLKQSSDKFDRGCYWWMKRHKLLNEYKKYLKNG